MKRPLALPRHSRKRRGSFLALSLIVAVMLAAIGASFISLTDTTAKVTEADFTERNMLYTAETGIDQAISTLNRYLAKSTTDGESWAEPIPEAATKEWTGASTKAFGAGGWVATTDGYRKDFGTMKLGNGRPARLRVLVRNVPNSSRVDTPSIVAEVTHNPQGSPGIFGAGTYSKQYVVWLKRSSRYQNSLVGIKSVKLADKMTVDSYRSTLGIPSSGNRGDRAVVASNSAIQGAISGGNVDIYGYVVTGGDDATDNFSAGSRIYGKNSVFPYADASGKGIDPNRLAHDFSSNFTTPTAPSTAGLLDLDLLLQNAPIINGVLVLPAGSYRLSNPLNLPKPITRTTQVTENVTTWIPLVGNVVNTVTKTVTEELSLSTIKVVGNVTIVVAGNPGADPATLPSIKFAGSSKLALPVESSLKIYTPGNLDLTGGGIVSGLLDILGTDGKPKDFRIYGTNTNKADGMRQQVAVAGAGNFSAIIDAPNADVMLKTGGSSEGLLGLGAGSDKYAFQGAAIGYTVTNDGAFDFHYDEALGAFMFPTFTLDSWVELKGDNRLNFASYGF